MGLIRNTLTRATQGYTTTGAFSFEFKKRSDIIAPFLMGEFFLLLGPSKYDQTFHYNLSVQPTYDGAAIVDYGNGVGQIQLSGELHAYYYGKVPMNSPLSVTGAPGNLSANGFANLLSELNPLNKKPGFMDFFDMMWLFWYSRNRASFQTKKPVPSFIAGESGGANQIFRQAVPLAEFDLEKIQIVYHDYDRDMHVEVAPMKDGFKISQQNNAPFDWQWSLSLYVLGDIDSIRVPPTPPIPDPSEIINNVLSQIDSVFQVLSAPLVAAAEIVSNFTTIKAQVADLKSSLKSYTRNSRDAIRSISRNVGLIRVRRDKLKSLIEDYYLPNINTQLYYTSPGVSNVNIAMDGTYRDLDAVIEMINQVSLALMVDRNELISTTSKFVTIKPGDTWEILAGKYLGNPSKASEIKQANGIGIAGKGIVDLYGTRIRVPGQDSVDNTTNTGIFVERKEDPTPTQIETETFGEDFAIDDSGDFAADYASDFAVTSGIDCLIEHALDRLTHQQGTIPLHPEWGAASIPGELPDDWASGVEETKIIQNLQQDEGVQNADILHLTMDGDMVNADIEITPIAGYEPEKINLIKPRTRGWT